MRITKKNFQDEKLPHELHVTTREKAKIKIAFSNNMSTAIKFGKAQLSKLIKSGGFLSALLGKLAGLMMKNDVPLAKNVLAPLATISLSNVNGNLLIFHRFDIEIPHRKFVDL